MYRQTQNLPETAAPQRLPKWGRLLSVFVVALAFAVLMHTTLLLAAPPSAPATVSPAQSVPDHGGDGRGEPHDEIIVRYGVIVTRPEASNEGAWVISKTTETTYTVTSDTDIEQELPVGTCVEVKSLDSAPDVALKIREKDHYYCDSEGQHDDGKDDHEEYIVVYGEIITRPETNLGSWVISNTEVATFTVTDSTLLEGELEVGACVAVKALASDPETAVKILELDAHHCVRGNDDDHDKDRPGNEDHRNYWIAYGIVITRPETNIGTWVIGNLSYRVTEETIVEFDHGGLDVGTCVKVIVHKDAPTVALKIESEEAYECHRDAENNAKAVLFGMIQKLPPDLQNGIWVVGGVSFTVSSGTELVSKGFPFTEGQIVKVQFSTDISGTNFARRIEFKFGHNNPCRDFDSASALAAHGGPGHNDKGKGDDDRHDDHDRGHHHFYGYCPGREGRAFGIIDERPDGVLLGDWIIGGIPYSATAFTEFKGGDFLKGERVKVEYVVLNDGLRLATKIQEFGGFGDPDASIFVGTVITKPEAFVGWWNIGGGLFEAIPTTEFIERGTLFAEGSYVVVNYEIVDDRRLIHRILTYIPPGAGDDNQVGTLQSIGGAEVSAANSPLQSEEIWMVDGIAYTVSEATQLVDSGGELVEGATVYVNSYSENGQRYATMIRTQGGQLYIPKAAR